MIAPIDCYIALGSNMDDPICHVTKAIDELADLPDSKLLRASSLYRSKAIGPPQADYINAVVALATRLAAQQLLVALQQLEQQHHRIRTMHWGPRTLDCDILLYGDAIINDANLTIPHPRLQQRAFVLVPLAEIAPSLILPQGEALATLLANSETQEINKLG